MHELCRRKNTSRESKGLPCAPQENFSMHHFIDCCVTPLPGYTAHSEKEQSINDFVCACVCFCVTTKLQFHKRSYLFLGPTSQHKPIEKAKTGD